MPDSTTPLPQHVQSNIQWHARKYREALRHMNPAWSAHQLDDAARNYSDNAIAQLNTYTWSVESLRRALREHDPQLVQDLIIVRTDYDFGLSRALILVWSLQNEELIKGALRAIAPGMLPIVYSTITDASSLGIPPEQWRPLWVRSVRRDHVVYVNDHSEYGDKAVAQAQREYRDFKQQMAEILEGLRPIVATPRCAEMVADWFTLLAHDAEQLVRHYRAMPPGTLVPSSEAAACSSAVVEAALFGFARDAIAKYRARGERAGAFDQFVLTVIGKLVDALPTYIAYVAKDWPGEAGLGAVISTAGAVIANTRCCPRIR